MNQLDVYYRGLLEYRQLTTANRECTVLRGAMASANSENDLIEIQRVMCTVDEEWVKTIEEGLIPIEKAIREERQFIRSNGEVIPIEKVRHVSRESVEHLAKHSDLITRFEEGEDIIPDQLYTVERLSDFTVYENRFLYMLLCYLRDFVLLRYNTILDLTTRYDGKIEMNKTLISGKQKIRYTISMYDERRQDWYLQEHNPIKEILRRIDGLVKTIILLLETPLMQEVAKVPMIKPPITKTNVLKMNKNFKAAVALYDYIIAYDKKGYETEEVCTKISPFRSDLADELAEASSLIAFLTYEYGLGLKADLKVAYNQEEERRKLEKIQQRAERIRVLQRKLRAAQISIEDYTLTLEKQLRALEGEAERAQALSQEVERLTVLSAEQAKKIEELLSEIEGLNAYIVELKRAHQAEIEALKAEHAEEIRVLNEQHAEEIQRLHADYQAQIEALHADYQGQIAALHADYQGQIAALHEDYQGQIAALHADYQGQIADLHTEYQGQIETMQNEHAEEVASLHADYQEQIETIKTDYTAQLDGVKQELEQTRHDSQRAIAQANAAAATKEAAYNELTLQYEAQIEENKVAQARIKVLGGIPIDSMERDQFNQLEDEYRAFEKLYEAIWKSTKKKIRKQHINMENLKEQTEQDKNSDK